MKKMFKLGSLFLLLSFVIASCSKETDVLPTANSVENGAADLTADFLNDVTNYFDEVEYAVDAEGDLFLANEGVPFYLDMNPVMADNSVHAKNGKSLCGLTGDLKLNAKQKAAAKRYWSAYQKCRKSADAKLRAQYNKIRRAHKARMAKMRSVIKRTKDPRIAKKYRASMKRMQDSFKETMKNRGDAHLQRMKACHNSYLLSVRSILSKAQYKAMITCLKKQAQKAKKKLKPIKKKHRKIKKKHRKINKKLRKHRK